MDDFRSLLDVLLRGDKDETDRRKRVRGRPVPVNPQPPVPQRGAFYESRPAQPRLAPQYMVGPGAAYIPVEQAAPRERPLPRDNPGAYETFADYVNAVEHLRDPRAPVVADVVRDPEPWRQNREDGRHAFGAAGNRAAFGIPDATEQLTPQYLATRQRPMYEAHYRTRMQPNGSAIRLSEPVFDPVVAPPASAYQRVARTDPHEADNRAWNEALRRTRVRMDAERRQEMARIPRPGYPLIAQAWAEPGAPRRRRDGQ